MQNIHYKKAVELILYKVTTFINQLDYRQPSPYNFHASQTLSQLAIVGIEDVNVETPLSINLLPNHHVPA